MAEEKKNNLDQHIKWDSERASGGIGQCGTKQGNDLLGNESDTLLISNKVTAQHSKYLLWKVF